MAKLVIQIDFLQLLHSKILPLLPVTAVQLVFKCRMVPCEVLVSYMTVMNITIVCY